MKEDIKTYYNNLASEYDQLRFSNSYGKYIHAQEERILSKYINTDKNHNNLDLACGTGRFLKYANHGIDISEEMIKQAKINFPDKELSIGDAMSIPFDNEKFENVFCFHLMMHLDNDKLNKILQDVNRITKKRGYFIFDIPSRKRRDLTSYKNDSWHGSNSISKRKLLKLISGNWELVNYNGVAFFPVHRIPKMLRTNLIKYDSMFCDSMIKEYSSHLIFILRKI